MIDLSGLNVGRLLSTIHFYISLGSGGQIFIPALCFGDGSRGRMLLICEVPLLFEFERVRVVVVDGARVVPSYPLLSESYE